MWLRQRCLCGACPHQAPLFTLKSKLFNDSTFVIGYDTAIRLIMPKYYGGEVPMLLELAAMRYRCAQPPRFRAFSGFRPSAGHHAPSCSV